MEYKFYKVEKVPDLFPHENIFICSCDKTIKFKCPCGCKNLIVLNNNPNKDPYYRIEEESIIGSNGMIISGICKKRFTLINRTVIFY